MANNENKEVYNGQNLLFPETVKKEDEPVTTENTAGIEVFDELLAGPTETTIISNPVNKVKKERIKSVAKTVKDEITDKKSLMYAKQESKRAPKVQIDQRLILWSWIAGIMIAFISSGIVSFNGITAVAEFVGLSQAWMSGLFFFFIELMYLLYLIAYLVLGSRIDEDGQPEKTSGALIGMVAFGGIAVFANGFHTLDFWDWAWTNPQMWAGLVLSIAAPIAIISASKMASRVVFAKAIRL